MMQCLSDRFQYFGYLSSFSSFVCFLKCTRELINSKFSLQWEICFL